MGICKYYRDIARDSHSYRLGGVWPPTTYVVLRGLTRAGWDDVVGDIAANYHDVIVKCHQTTETVSTWQY